MVSPRDSWDDVEDGYRSGDVGVFVEPRRVDGEEGRVAERATDYADADAFAVSMCRALGSDDETSTPLVSFADARTAWEYANLVTHYVSESFDPRFAETELRGNAGHDPDGWRPDGPVSDLSAADVLLRMVGDKRHKLAGVLDVDDADDADDADTGADSKDDDDSKDDASGDGDANTGDDGDADAEREGFEGESEREEPVRERSAGE